MPPRVSLRSQNSGLRESGTLHRAHKEVTPQIHQKAEEFADKFFVSAFFRRAEEILEIATAGSADMGDTLMVLDRQGGFRMLQSRRMALRHWPLNSAPKPCIKWSTAVLGARRGMEWFRALPATGPEKPPVAAQFAGLSLRPRQLC